jgi:DNA-binding GntR family transcriptional regulator
MTPTKNAGLRVTDALRAAILGGRWEPGVRLQPASLSTQFEVSTTIIREALTRLTGEGLVVVRHNRGFFVRELSLRELGDITELRCATDAIAVRLSLTRGDLEWESELIAAHHQLARTPRRITDDPSHISEEWSKVHFAFHRALIGACDCEPMISLSANLAMNTELYRRWAAPTRVAIVRDVEQEHREILEAALDRDVPRTTSLLSAHYQKTVQIVLESGLLHDDTAA